MLALVKGWGVGGEKSGVEESQMCLKSSIPQTMLLLLLFGPS